MGGRKKGSPNKFTNNIKDMVLNALNDKRIGGEEGFIKWIIVNKRNKGMFYSWCMKMLPSNISVEGGLNITFELSEKYMPKDKDEPE